MTGIGCQNVVIWMLGSKDYLPVLPEVASMTMLFPGIRVPSFSAASTIAFAILSLTEPPIEVTSTLPTGKGVDGNYEYMKTR